MLFCDVSIEDIASGKKGYECEGGKFVALVHPRLRNVSDQVATESSAGVLNP